MEQKTLTRLHNVLLEMMNEFVRICEEHNLIYYMVGGTLLGAVRHKGFIPWDDDIDIAMPRNDYEKFLDMFDKNNETDYYVLSYRNPLNQSSKYRKFAKFCKKCTVLMESDVKNPKDYSGIFIDIWPIDNCVNIFFTLQIYLISFAWKLFLLKTQAYIPNRWIKRFFVNIFCYIFSLKFCKNLIRKSYSIFNKFKTKYICCFPGVYGYKKETHRYDAIFPLSKICFEGNYYWAPGNPDMYLKRIYGNYMELPSVEQRRAHDVLSISFGD